MKRLVPAIVAAYVAAAGLGAASASPGLPAGGTAEFALTDFQERLAGPNAANTFHAVGSWQGTFAGTTDGDFSEVVRVSGVSQSHGSMTCVCTVGDRSGTVTFASEITAELDPVTFDFGLHGRLVATTATGGLTGLHAVIDIVLENGVTSYAGTYHFD